MCNLTNLAWLLAGALAAFLGISALILVTDIRRARDGFR